MGVNPDRYGGHPGPVRGPKIGIINIGYIEFVVSWKTSVWHHIYIHRKNEQSVGHWRWYIANRYYRYWAKNQSPLAVLYFPWRHEPFVWLRLRHLSIFGGSVLRWGVRTPRAFLSLYLLFLVEAWLSTLSRELILATAIIRIACRGLILNSTKV